MTGRANATRRALLVFMALAACASAPALGQVFSGGPEFQVNSYRSGTQYAPAVDSDAGGSFVVVWAGFGRDGSGSGIFGRLFGADGRPRSGDIQINQFTTGAQIRPDLAVAPDGRFAVVWSSFGQDGSSIGVFGRLFHSTGAPSTDEFQVNTTTSGLQSGPGIAMDDMGSFVVVWTGFRQDGSTSGVFGQIFDSSGHLAGSEFQVNSYTTGTQSRPDAAMDGIGNFVVTWSSLGQDGSAAGIFGQRFDGTGSTLGGEFPVNAFTSGRQSRPEAAMNDDGSFIVAWTSFDQDGSGGGVCARQFDSAGTPIGDDIQVNLSTVGSQSRAAVDSGPAGEFIVAWEAAGGLDGSGAGIFGRGFDPSGAGGDEILINEFTAGAQVLPGVSMDSSGAFVAVWESYDQDGSGGGIFGRRFLPPPDCAAGDMDRDWVCDGQDNCPDLYNPGQEDLDGDGVGDSCDVLILLPFQGAVLNCISPRNIRPTIVWDPGSYERFRVQIAWRRGFKKEDRVTSGRTFLTGTSWSPSRKKWTRACQKSREVRPDDPILFFRILGKDVDLPREDPAKKTFSQIVKTGTFP